MAIFTANRKIGRSRTAMRITAFALFFSSLAIPASAHADSATVSVGDPDRFAAPPREAHFMEQEAAPSSDLYRSPFRLNVGPVAATSGRGLGLGVGVAADFGTGTVGARISGAWARGENSSDSQSASNEGDLGAGLGQYTGELTLDFHKHGPVHPVFGVGFGLAHIQNSAGGGNAGIGIARLGIEYSLGLEDADVRLGAGVTGVLAGPEDKEVENLRGYALIGAQIAIGF